MESGTGTGEISRVAVDDMGGCWNTNGLFVWGASWRLDNRELWFEWCYWISGRPCLGFSWSAKVRPGVIFIDGAGYDIEMSARRGQSFVNASIKL